MALHWQFGLIVEGWALMIGHNIIIVCRVGEGGEDSFSFTWFTDLLHLSVVREPPIQQDGNLELT